MKKELIGIVACGGKSSRMGQDKSLLTYHTLPQRYHVFQMLEGFCAERYISCSKEQEAGMDTLYPMIADHPDFKDAGPLTALLSAMSACSGKNILLLGCDYPYLTPKDIEEFLTFIERDIRRPAAFYDLSAASYVPVLGYYPQGVEIILNEYKTEADFSLQRFLKNEKAARFLPRDPDVMISVDSPDMMVLVRNKLLEKIS